MKPDVKIRRADALDANLLAALGGTTNYETYFETDEPADLARYIADFFNPQAMKIELEDAGNSFFIAEINGKAVGYAKLRTGQPAECVAGENTIELHRIYVLEKMTRHGIGKILLQTCFDEAKARGFDSLWLAVFELNSRAVEFYGRQGFAQAGETGFYYGEQRFNCFVMKIKL
ncbi:MAG TPA: GNAT family N-acetyltransferase [Pyrinomonadaceae bacterium]|nr:GNAT family N-acetyltransferase [Pyrinomonadaceae bacterium]